MSPGRPLSVLPAVTEGVTHWLCGIARTTDYCALLPGGDYFPFMRICFFFKLIHRYDSYSSFRQRTSVSLLCNNVKCRLHLLEHNEAVICSLEVF